MVSRKPLTREFNLTALRGKTVRFQIQTVQTVEMKVEEDQDSPTIGEQVDEFISTELEKGRFPNKIVLDFDPLELPPPNRI